MKLIPDISWRGRAPVDARLVPLLRAIRGEATLRAAAATLGMSYRSAWDVLAAQARELGTPLVVMERGRGARLAPLAERLLAADDAARRVLGRLEPQIAVSVTAAERAGGLRQGRICASHDLLLAAYFDAHSIPMELSFKASMECLTALAQGSIAVAGFHVSADSEAAMRLLRPRAHQLVRFAVREQGLMLAQGNPKRIRGLADVAAKRLLFVNRQRGSGTRLLLDQMLQRAGLRPDAIRGYNTEEFTHLAVAATIAAGRADAGFGVRAAAARFGLGFLPLKRERYWFALRRRERNHAGVQAFLEAVGGDALQRMARQFPGYDARGAGEVCAIEVLAEEEQQ